VLTPDKTAVVLRRTRIVFLLLFAPGTLMSVANGIDSLATTENGRKRCKDKAMSARTGLIFDVLTAVISQDYTGGADKSLARPGKKQATATEDFEFRVSYL
jgi:hypothetical protein